MAGSESASVAAAARLPANGSNRQIRYLSTAEAYDRWAEVYDTDGNFLQALDTIEMQTLVPQFLSEISTCPENDEGVLVDLGCGTGRNTVLLLQQTENCDPRLRIVGVDVSPKMLEVARERINHLGAATRASVGVFDLLNQTVPETAGTPSLISKDFADGLVSTLVLEHIPLQTFFSAVSQIVKPGGVLLVTNMHSDMGAISQAGFVDPVTGEKIRPTSYAHRVEDVVEEAKKFGFEVLQEVTEQAVDEELARKLGKRAQKWIGVKVWFGLSFKRT